MDWAKNSIDKLNAAKKSLGNRRGPSVLWMKEREDDAKLRICDYKLKNGIPTMAQTLCDFGEGGIACLAGAPNSGKSSIIVNMMLGACELNKDLLIIDVTLDDPYRKRYQQYIACLTGLAYQQITTGEMTDREKQEMTDAENKILKFYSEDKLRTLEAIEKHTTPDGMEVTRHFREPEEICRIMREARKEKPNHKIAIFIDAWNDLDFSKGKGSGDLSQVNYYLAKLKEEANKHMIMLFISAHLRKREPGKKKPGIDEIKGTSDMAYSSVWAGIVTNEMRESMLKEPLEYTEQDKIYPVIVVDVVKTKMSTWDMPMLYVLKALSCQIIPLHDYQYKNYLDIYRGKRK